MTWKTKLHLSEETELFVQGRGLRMSRIQVGVTFVMIGQKSPREHVLNSGDSKIGNFFISTNVNICRAQHLRVLWHNVFFLPFSPQICNLAPCCSDHLPWVLLLSHTGGAWTLVKNRSLSVFRLGLFRNFFNRGTGETKEATVTCSINSAQIRLLTLPVHRARSSGRGNNFCEI